MGRGAESEGREGLRAGFGKTGRRAVGETVPWLQGWGPSTPGSG